jgi:60S ribosome subunit biogenesis protein NIP7
MRPLDEAETTQVLEKLHKFVGSNLRHLIERRSHEGCEATTTSPGGYCLRLHKQRVYYVSEALVRRATNVGREKLCGLGTCLGKFTKSGKFRLVVTCVDLLAAHAKYKIWLKPSAEMSFLYGNHVLKSGLGRITDNTPQYQGVVIYSMSDVPLGFGLAAKSTQECRKLDPNDIVALHQADLGEYLRLEDEL